MVFVSLVSKQKKEKQKRMAVAKTWTPTELSLLLNRDNEHKAEYVFSIKETILKGSIGDFMTESRAPEEETLEIEYFLVQEKKEASGPIRCLFYSPETGTLSGLGNGFVEHLDRNLNASKRYRENASPITEISCFTFKEAKHVSFSHQNGCVAVYPLESILSGQEPVHSYKCTLESSVSTTVFSENTLFIATWEGTVARWSIENSKNVFSRQVHTDKITGMGTSGSLLVTASWDGTVRLLQKDTLKELSVYSTKSAITASVFVEDCVVCFSVDGFVRKIKFGDGKTKKVERTKKTLGWVSKIHSHSETLSLSSHDGSIVLLEYGTLKTVSVFPCTERKLLAHAWTDTGTIVAGDDRSQYCLVSVNE
ncbi:MAG: uncharacterized protein A8A55_0203 [Amphiamblys sp. WSBS2006]|nr:MAG: uncharacterized protein A8A55_0203 [Amphiamblys sp. WSBS2006]